MRVNLENPSRRREAEFLRSARASRSLHRSFVRPPATPEGYRRFLALLRRKDQAAFFVTVLGSRDLAGVVTIDDIARGSYQSANLGYYAFASHARQGYMREGLILAITHSFRILKLHRLEANIEPVNRRSIELVASLGFRKEGVALRFAKLGGRWRDLERWAMLADEWNAAHAARGTRRAPLR
jgi:[ribosomal protein S5]-alanine N-acetyltransferase